MYTLLILLILIFILSSILYFNRGAVYFTFILCSVLLIISAVFFYVPPKEYKYISSISYVSKSGVLKTVEAVYEKDDKYYKRDGSVFSANAWIPFTHCNYIEVEVSGKVVSCIYNDNVSGIPYCDGEKSKNNCCLCNKETTTKILCPNCDKQVESTFCPDCG